MFEPEPVQKHPLYHYIANNPEFILTQSETCLAYFTRGPHQLRLSSFPAFSTSGYTQGWYAAVLFEGGVNPYLIMHIMDATHYRYGCLFKLDCYGHPSAVAQRDVYPEGVEEAALWFVAQLDKLVTLAPTTAATIAKVKRRLRRIVESSSASSESE